MAGLYTVKVVTEFSAAHALRDYPGDCSRLHGHNWKVEAEVCTRSLDQLGMSLDFKQLKQAVQCIIQRFDHYNLNDLPPFDTFNPTAENIATYLYQELAKSLNDSRIQVKRITLWETDRACVQYTEDTE